MVWVDHSNYYGPNRRRKPPGLRLNERRREDASGHTPLLSNALRHLRLMIIDTNGQESVDRFIMRASAIAELARERKEVEAARALTSLSAFASRNRDADLRPILYEGLDRVQRSLRVFH
jgi:hypothetical protein